MGTAGYMSPEQAGGRAVDFRSDQFSFGSLLYEMATGNRAFARGSAVQTLAAIMQEEPDAVGSINPQVPVPLRWIIERCLAKDPEERYASTKDWPGTSHDEASPTPLARRAALGFSAVAPPSLDDRPDCGGRCDRAGHDGLEPSPSVWQNPRRCSLQPFDVLGRPEVDASISSDGKFVAFLADRDGPFDAWVGQVGSEFLNSQRAGSRSPTRSFITSDSPMTEPTCGSASTRRTGNNTASARTDDRRSAAGIPAERR